MYLGFVRFCGVGYRVLGADVRSVRCVVFTQRNLLILCVFGWIYVSEFEGVFLGGGFRVRGVGCKCEKFAALGFTQRIFLYVSGLMFVDLGV